MVKTCPFFGKCGGCKFDFAATDYREKKLKQFPISDHDAPFWAPVGARRRADFCFSDGKFGFFAPHSKDIVQITNCPNLVDEINNILPRVAALPWNGSGACLITLCDNGIDINIESNVPFFSTEFKNAMAKLPILRATWNGKVVCENAEPTINFNGQIVPYTAGAFLQPTLPSESAVRNMVIDAASHARHVADLFCGLGNFTYSTGADGFDIAGIGTSRDLFRRPLSDRQLNQYDCVIIDPPRAGAMAQCKELAKSNVARIIYVSCNPESFRRDASILTSGGYKITRVVPIDQFVGSAHWELFAILEK